MKKCSKCGILKNDDDFNKSSYTSTGLRSWCRECEKIMNNAYHDLHLESERKRKREWARSPAGIYNSIKYGKKRKPLSMSKEEFIEWYKSQDRKCEYCGITLDELNLIKDTHNNKTCRLSIDCIDNNKGYSLDNICLCCLRCNYIKNDFFSYNDMKEIGKRYVTPKWKEQLNGSD